MQASLTSSLVILSMIGVVLAFLSLLPVDRLFIPIIDIGLCFLLPGSVVVSEGGVFIVVVLVVVYQAHHAGVH